MQPREFSGFDISSQEFWSRPFDVRDETFARLRAHEGLTWHEPWESIFGVQEPGFWAVTRREDIVFVSQHPELFTSAQGVSLNPMPAEIQRFASFFLTMDPPQHTVYRRLISSAFTPRNVRQIEEQIQRNAAAIVDELVGAGDIEFVSACSARLPMLTIMDMLGVPRADQPAVAYAAEKLFGLTDEEYGGPAEGPTDPTEQIALLSNTGIELARFRRQNPGDDLMTSIVNAEVDGHRLSDEEIGAFLILLASAGNDTTKQTTTHAIMALAHNPDQRAWLMEDFDGRIGQAVEEFVRWASPVLQFARFATQDTEINGHPVRAGEKLGLFYCSANRDERVFTDPHVFDLQRSPNPHVGFGGGGPHFCLGNQLAKTELRILFRELLTRLTTIEVGEPDLLFSSFVHGVKRLPAYVK
ncbi:putative cytochrome P450 [Mycolicibacterium hassiacum DSM 44199]|uniref:Steroid C26-monooxygenase n=1 Tax=Mycolicibacterium hassiacum (strain DSM 44199 / CIP 105218 / JCM 12690 / 3849) TaxID=1122247 RepID=K5BBM1_MYCHD|nr:putative cytochrome P450 [Mycolicibacterium hassiacum DSM 44199]MDA4086329.1 cytochrome P450 [Mycolicibacterium hassiacum DSM 44199]PZN18685.1 MAG: cytochrome P450 [Mycolicibacterium hassiacum]